MLPMHQKAVAPPALAVPSRCNAFGAVALNHFHTGKITPDNVVSIGKP